MVKKGNKIDKIRKDKVNIFFLINLIFSVTFVIENFECHCIFVDNNGILLNAGNKTRLWS